MPWRGIAGSYGGFIPCFLKNLQTIFHSGSFSLLPLLTIQDYSLFSTPSPVFIVCRFFDDGHSDWYKVISCCIFDLHFSNSDVEHLFMCLSAICRSSLEKCLFSSLVHFFFFFYCVVYFFWHWAAWAACIFWGLILCQLLCLLLLSPTLKAFFSPCLQFLSLCKSF